MRAQSEKASVFLGLHHRDEPLLMPNPWDLGSAKLLESLGFAALATTSSGFAATLGRPDGGVSRDEAIAHSAAMAACTELPVSADLENCFADDPSGVAETVRMAVGAGLAGCSIEDFTGRPDDPIYDRSLAVERVAAAAEVAHRGPVHLVLTARAENYLHGRPYLADTIARLQDYAGAGADVVFAPGVRKLDELAELVRAVGKPVNALPNPGIATVADLAAIGVARISVGGAFAWVALNAAARAATELRDHGLFGYLDDAAQGRAAGTAAFG
jgi:2-methylisocitrate lyase-like PEP mutase family enzyme